LDFVVRENLFFNQVRIEGLTAPPSDASAAAAMQLTLGQTYRQAAVNEALERLRETLRDEGLYQAEVVRGNGAASGDASDDIVVHIKPGPARTRGYHPAEERHGISDAEILSRLKMKVGGTITSAKVQRRDGPHPQISSQEGASQRASRSAPGQLRCRKEHGSSGPGCNGRTACEGDVDGREVFQGRAEKN